MTACVKSLRACVGDWLLHCEDCEVFLLSHDRWWVVHAKYGVLKHSFDAALKWCVWLYICCVNIEVNPNFLKWTLFFLQSLDCVETDALLTDILYAVYLKTDLRDWILILIYCRPISETEYWDWYVQMLYAAPLLRPRLICANVVCYILLVTDIKKPVYDWEWYILYLLIYFL